MIRYRVVICDTSVMQTSGYGMLWAEFRKATSAVPAIRGFLDKHNFDASHFEVDDMDIGAAKADEYGDEYGGLSVFARPVTR